MRDAAHVVACGSDWPGNFPSVSETIALLISFGADVNARFTGPQLKRALHCATSSDYVQALETLLKQWPELGSAGGVIGNGMSLGCDCVRPVERRRQFYGRPGSLRHMPRSPKRLVKWRSMIRSPAPTSILVDASAP